MAVNNSEKSIVQKNVLFYSSVGTKKMFSIQQFYRTDIEILRDLGYTVLLSNRLIDFLFFWNYEIAFIYFYRYGLVPAFMGKLFRKKVLFTGGIDNLDKEYSGKRSFMVQKYLFLLCTLFSDINILVSNADVQNIRRFKKELNPEIYPLVHHVIDFDRYLFKDISKKKKLFTTIAWMVKEENVHRKGVIKSIYLFKEIYKIDKEFRMRIIGPNGEGSAIVEEVIKNENLEGIVTLTGSVSEDEKIRFLKESLVYTQLSMYEGFGIAAIEALTAGNIVVHTGKGGLEENISEFGIKVEEEGNSEIIKKILKITSEPIIHQNLINSGIKHVSEKFRYSTRLRKFQEFL